MTDQTNQTAVATVDPKLVAAFKAFVAFMPDSTIRVAAGPSDACTFNMADVHPVVALELLRQGGIKPLTDMSRDKATEETWSQLNARRIAKVKNWKAGDFSVRGGGVSDPVAVQMREEVINALKDAGMPKDQLKEVGKGRADEILARIYDGDELKAAVTRYREKAAATIKARNEAAASIKGAKLELKGLKI